MTDVICNCSLVLRECRVDCWCLQSDLSSGDIEGMLYSSVLYFYAIS